MNIPTPQEIFRVTTTTLPSIDVSTVWIKIYSLIHEFWLLLPSLVIGIICFGIFILFSYAAKRFIYRVFQDKTSNVGLVLSRLAQYSIVIIGFLVAMTIIIPSLKPADMLAGFGFGSLAIGFAFKNILQNYFASIMILLQAPFKIGDQVKYQQFEGIVDEIDTRTTFLQTENGERILIPNGDIYTNIVSIKPFSEYYTDEYLFEVFSTNSIAKTFQLLLSMVKKVPGVLNSPEPELIIVDMNNIKTTFKIKWRVDTRINDRHRVRTDVLLKIKENIDKVLQAALLKQQEGDNSSYIHNEL